MKFVRYMTQSLSNDLPDKFGSSDEDEDDEEVVAWMGEGGSFETHGNEMEDGEEDDGEMQDYRRRALFQEEWDNAFPVDENEFRLRTLDGDGSGDIDVDVSCHFFLFLIH
jgi:hypothetical protein